MTATIRPALDALLAAAAAGSPDALRPAAESLAGSIVEAAGDDARIQVQGTTYQVRQVTWPVAPDGGAAFACPHIALTLLRGDAVLRDVRADYFDGHTLYRTVDRKIGRWSRFRMGSPGDRGYDLHLADDVELAWFADEAPAVVKGFGLT